MADKWDKYAQPADKWDKYATVETPDFTANPDKEGTYRMLDQGGKDIYVPYSTVRSATQGGYTMAKEDQPRFTADAAADPKVERFFPDINLGKGVRITGMNPAGDPVFGPSGTAPQGSAAKRFLSSTTDVLKGTASGMYHALKEGPQNQEEARTEYLSGPVGLRAKRLIIDPMLSEGRKARDAYRQSNFWSLHPTPEQRDQQALAIGHGMAAALPLAAPFAPVALAGPAVASASEQIGQQAGSGDIAGAAGTVTGNVLPFVAGEAVAKLPAKAVGKVSRLVERYEPREVDVGGTKIPVAVGEAHPLSPEGQTQLRLKRQGVKAEKFEGLQRRQQTAVKQAMRKVAEDTAEVIGLSDEPSVAMEDAAEVTHNKARQMYRILDQSLATIPGDLSNVSGLVKDAIRRVQKLGIDVTTDPAISGEVWVDKQGNPVTQQDMSPVKWHDAVQRGDITKTQLVQTQPLSVYMKLRSQLLKMQRSSADVAMRYHLGNEIRVMNDNIKTAMKGSPLYNTWQEANRLWAKGFTLRDVSDAIRDSTKGTPVEHQSSGVASVPPRLQAASLVQRLNTLAHDGILDDGFKPEEAHHLRESADLLDRIQRTKVGKEESERIPFHRNILAHVMSGAVPLTGTLAGGAVGALAGHPLVGAGIGGGLGFILKYFGERDLVTVMTDPRGVRALRKLAIAKTAAETMAAQKNFVRVATVVSAAQNRKPAKSPKDLRKEAQQLKPAGATASY